MKNVFFAFIAFLSIINTFGQDSKSNSKVRLGVFIGANRLTNPGKEKFFEGADFNADFGFQFGLNLDVPISKTFSFQPEIAYQRIGYSLKGSPYGISLFDPVDSSFESISYSNYLQLPLNFKLSLFEKMSLEFGLHLGSLLNSKLKNIDTFRDNNGLLKTTERIYEETGRKYIYGTNFGLNYNINKNIYINLRNTMIIVEGATLIQTFNNSILALNAGYRFN